MNEFFFGRISPPLNASGFWGRALCHPLPRGSAITKCDRWIRDNQQNKATPPLTWAKVNQGRCLTNGICVSLVSPSAISLDNQLVVLATTAADAGRYHVEAVNELTGENATSPAVYLSVSGNTRLLISGCCSERFQRSIDKVFHSPATISWGEVWGNCWHSEGDLRMNFVFMHDVF